MISEIAGLGLQQTLLQGAILEALLSPNKDIAYVQRKLITNELSKAFEEMVVAIAPSEVVEVGAHGAEFSREMARRVPGARVTAFEASPGVYESFRDAVSRSGVTYINRAIASDDGSVSFNTPLKRGVAKTTMGSLRLDRQADEHFTVEVPASRLDSVLSGDGALVLWVDVEGALKEVLAGADRSLARCALLYTEIETSQRWHGQALANEVIEVADQAGLVPFLRDVQREWQHNLLFVRPGVLSGDALPAIAQRYMSSVVTRIK